MAHKTADKLVYCHEAMHVQLRVQSAGWSPDVERWESDEDSEDSGDEREGDEQDGWCSERGSHPAADGVMCPRESVARVMSKANTQKYTCIRPKLKYAKYRLNI